MSTPFSTRTPSPPLPSGASPSGVVPTRLPSTWLPVGVANEEKPLKIEMPWFVLPDVTFRSLVARPPIVLFEPPSMAMPSTPFGIAVVPASFVPAKLPWTMFPSEASRKMPCPPLPETTLRLRPAAAADRVGERAVEPDAVALVAGRRPVRREPDDVAGDQVPRRAAVELDPDAAVRVDGVPANRVAAGRSRRARPARGCARSGSRRPGRCLRRGHRRRAGGFRPHRSAPGLVPSAASPTRLPWIVVCPIAFSTTIAP